jgi:RimJ/RimL family protein N-acetyltransferase
MSSAGKDLLRRLKDVAGAKGSQLGLKIPGYEGYFLRPVATRREHLDSADIACLTSWRNRYFNAFLTEFAATDERTSRWLSDVVHKDDSRILFMIEDMQWERVGYMGIAYIDWECSYVEADAIVSSGGTPKGMMSAALRTVLRWATGQLGLKVVAVRVLSDNPALAFYRKLGFEETKRVPLKRVVSDDFVSWVEDETLVTPERYLVHHLWNDHEN